MRKLLLTIGVVLFFTSFSFSQTNGADNNSKQLLLKENPNPTTQQITIKSDVLPDDFPKYKDSGNKKQDIANFHEAKQEWIKNNPERFEKIKKLNLNESIPTKKINFIYYEK